MGKSIMQMDASTLAAMKAEGYVAAAKSGMTVKVPLSDFAAQADLNQKIGDAPSDGKNYVRKNGAWSEIGDIGALADGGALTDGVSVEVPNNKLSTLSTSQATLTLNVTPTSGTVPNFAVEITASVACTVTVTSTVGGTPTTLKYAAAAGNELEASKTYQITCVGSCWTLAEFVTPGA